MFASPMDVPPDLLVPPEAYGRGFCPHDAALVLDGWLRRLAAQDARGRAILGRLARAFLRRRGHHELGFGRLGDYSRERLGVSARELQSLATVTARLERLPRLRAAFANGVLSWAQIRLLAAVATPEDEAEWLARAEGRTVRALAAVMRTPPDGEDDDAAAARFRLRCPRRVRLLWLHVKAEWEGQPRHRDPVFARDGWRCAVPVCTARRELHDHHVVFRSRGGGNERGNRVTLCAWHHLRGIHAGRVRAEGEAPDGIAWEIGVRPGRRALLRLVGERYATG